jgi:RND family efflux transporter MFP subunit
MKKAVAIIFILFGSLGILAYVTYANRLSTPTVDRTLVRSLSRTRPPVQTVIIKPETLEERLIATGVINPEQDIIVTSEVSGKVLVARKDLGDSCKKGELLVRLDSESYRIAVSQAAAALEQARVGLKHREKDWKRIEQLQEGSVVTPQQLDGAQEAVSSGSATVAQADAALLLARRNLRETNVRCPFSGLVAEMMVDVGQAVSPATPLARLVDVSRLKIVLSVTSDKLSRLAMGMPVVLSDPSDPRQTFRGKVSRIGVAADTMTRTFPVEVEVESGQDGLRAGQVVRAELELKEYTDAVAIPRAALVQGEQGDAVFVVEGEMVKRVAVEVGPEIDGRLVILSGLKSGDEVVALGASTLENGELVEVKGRTEKSPSSDTPSKAQQP